jgi:O-antigen ligase
MKPTAPRLNLRLGSPAARRRAAEAGAALAIGLAAAGAFAWMGALAGVLIAAALGGAALVLIALYAPALTVALWLFTTVGVQEVLGLGAVAVGGGVDLRVSDPVLSAMAAVLLIRLLGDDRRTYVVLLRDGVCWTLFVLWLLGQMAVSVSSFGLVSVLGEFRSYFHHILVIPYIVSVVRSRAALRRVFGATVALALVLVPIGFLKGGLEFGFSFQRGKWLVSSPSLAVVYGAFAAYLMQRYGRWPTGRLLHGGLLLLVVTLTVVAGHRSVWMAAAAGLGTLVLLGELRLGKVAKMGVAVGVVVALLDAAYAEYSLVGFLQERSKAFFATREDPTANWRLVLWQSAWDQAQAHLWTGKGLGNYFSARDTYGNVVKASLHNQYIQVVYQVGLVGLGLYAAFVAQTTWHLVRAYRRAADATAATVAATALAVLGAATAFYIAYGFEHFTWVFIALGLAAALQQRRRGRAAGAGRP